MQFFKDLSLSAIVAGFITVLVGFTSSAVIVFEAARALGATPDQIASWIWALSLGMGVNCIGLSLYFRVPIAIGWSTPGAAMIVTAASGISLPEAIGAFIVCGLMMAVFGFSGWFERGMRRIPMPIAAAMLAGVLFKFGLDVFLALQTNTVLVGTMVLAYFLMRRYSPRYAVLSVLLLGIAVAFGQDRLDLAKLSFEVAQPIFVTPQFSIAALIGVALPLFVVTMASQNAPGVAVIRASGYTNTPISPLIGWTGLTTVVLAPFGGFSLNLAAITAAICMGREAHDDPARRYTAAVMAGVVYLVVAFFAVSVVALFTAFPRELIAAIAGLALFGTIANALNTALAEDTGRESALLCFFVTVSGISFAGIGSAFWGLLMGGAAFWFLHRPKAV